ncbi:exopolysaccharide biosynthesis protein [Lysobacter hankyongensis]|uniref:Exopolysaccharide biosynthesis protein n=1 Tax=Lysobacter hankyongensis TaxID=1176535 RepID=A0ABP9AI24_9GAMM
MTPETDPSPRDPAERNVDEPPSEGRIEPQGMRAVIDALCDGDPDERLQLRELVGDLGRSTFGVLLFIATLPALIPIPGVAGALSGPLVVLVGLHLLILLRKPWLPDFVARRGPQRSTLIRFDRNADRWLRWLEKLIRPRLTAITDHPAATVFTGLQLVLLGILLALPIPFTNYLFAGLLLVYALALLERDGVLMLIAWAAGIIAIYVFGAVSGNLVAMLWAWIASLG